MKEKKTDEAKATAGCCVPRVKSGSGKTLTVTADDRKIKRVDMDNDNGSNNSSVSTALSTKTSRKSMMSISNKNLSIRNSVSNLQQQEAALAIDQLKEEQQYFAEVLGKLSVKLGGQGGAPHVHFKVPGEQALGQSIDHNWINPQGFVDVMSNISACIAFAMVKISVLIYLATGNGMKLDSFFEYGLVLLLVLLDALLMNAMFAWTARCFENASKRSEVIEWKIKHLEDALREAAETCLKHHKHEMEETEHEMTPEEEEKMEREAIERLPETMGLSVKQNMILEEFKKLYVNKTCKEIEMGIGTFRLDNETFLRFLVARDFNIAKAQKMLDNHLEFRNKYVPAAVKREDLLRPMKAGFSRLAGFTKLNYPVALVQIEYLDPDDFIDVDHNIRFVMYLLEKLSDKYLSVRKGVTKGVIIQDLHGFSLKKHWNAKTRAMLKALITIAQDHFPERLDKIFILHAPSVFVVVWNFIQLFLDPVIRNKIQFVTKMSQLQEYIDPEYLYVQYGGTRTEPYPTADITFQDCD